MSIIFQTKYKEVPLKVVLSNLKTLGKTKEDLLNFLDK